MARSDDYWIDGTDEIIKGYWVWASTGKPISFTNWVHNEPNNVHGNEDCLEIGNWNKVGTWNDASCSVEDNFICEMEYPASGSIIGK
ncbi:Hypothetical predicted protein [Mytilus galloprovincialis]|uniref:C-type lectin domain-containing protein n=1 Tax=Mytilus galloprovincialis TaxID=29158 RepID=A0A8B6GW30_MYTGA|nr:Hypothetical predicted protein [Mytilus galloprovincialis]